MKCTYSKPTLKKSSTCTGPGSFFEKQMGGRVEKWWCHVPIPLTQGPVHNVDGCPALYRAPKDRPSKRLREGHVLVRELHFHTKSCNGQVFF